MSRYDHKIETSLEGIEHLSKEREDAPRRCQQKEERKPVEHKTTPRLRERTLC